MSRIPVFYIDVDDTLVRHVGAKIILMPQSINHVKLLKEQGALLYCWSSAGAKEAQRICESLQIDHLFEAFLPKPNVMIDDCSIDTWPDLKSYHPNQLSSEGLAFYVKELKW